MKKFISLALVVVMVLSMSLFMASCGSDDEGGDAGEATKNTVVRCVISTSLGDQSFNDSANAGITELQNAAAQFLSLGGSCGGAAELAGVGFFMPEEDITEAEMARAAAYMNAGGNASEVYKAIEQNG